MIKVFNNLEELKRYYDEETDTYIFKENNEYIEEIIINFDLNIESNIEASNISAPSITAKKVFACNIHTWDINTGDIYSNDIYAGVIHARDVNAQTIRTMDIYTRDIKAYSVGAVNIYARDIVYMGTCYAYEDFKCNSIKCRRELPIHCSLYGKLEVTENDKSV